MAYAQIVTTLHGTVIRCTRFPEGHSTADVDNIASTLDSIIDQDRKALRVEVDYTGCNDADVITHYDP